MFFNEKICRREFILGSLALGLGGYVAACADSEKSPLAFPIQVFSNQDRGHQLLKSLPPGSKKPEKIDYLIIGGGLAGLSAAYTLRDKDYLICDLNEQFGGTSRAFKEKGRWLCQGAHYDLDYPAHFGQEALKLLEEIGVLEFEKNSSTWRFKDQEFYIDANYESQYLSGNRFREDVLPDSPEVAQFMKKIKAFYPHLKLPSRLIAKPYRALNQISFSQYLEKEHAPLSFPFQEALDYQMRDDFGGSCQEISALAGLYYYASRPYEKDTYGIFSPPQGNYYFVRKILEQLNPAQCSVNHLAYKIQPKKNHFRVELLDVEQKEKRVIEAKNVVFAAQKHSLKYILPEVSSVFQNNQYIPWLVINFQLKDFPEPKFIFWQNEMTQANSRFLGFVDSRSQYNPLSEAPIFTLYLCLDRTEQELLAKYSQKPEPLIRSALHYLAKFWNISFEELNQKVRKAWLSCLGHAMPRPYPGYLFKDANQNRPYPNLTYAGVDNARLPLLLEAIDSGIQASKLLS